jgi:RHH-type proline utilization regulon transcriptional repressor/proline dehydrogenase/delta 1-pyrroline-5-carboxylate dehydrogenase
VVRYKRRDLDALVSQINATGYGLTLGVHTRIDETVDQIVENGRAGNVYVNRNIVGAVVGVQPFGGEGLSGTGPKAGGPLYMYRMLSRRPDDVMVRALADADPGNAAAQVATGPGNTALIALAQWALATDRPDLAASCGKFSELSRSGYSRTLAGPTGERNVYTLVPREAVLCLADSDADRLTQLAAVIAVGSKAVWPASEETHRLLAVLPSELRQSIAMAQDWTAETVTFDAALHHGSKTSLAQVIAQLAERKGAIVGIRSLAPGETDIPLEALVIERALSVNTAAAGGNASLMTIG